MTRLTKLSHVEFEVEGKKCSGIVLQISKQRVHVALNKGVQGHWLKTLQESHVIKAPGPGVDVLTEMNDQISLEILASVLEQSETPLQDLWVARDTITILPPVPMEQLLTHEEPEVRRLAASKYHG